MLLSQKNNVRMNYDDALANKSNEFVHNNRYIDSNIR